MTLKQAYCPCYDLGYSVKKRIQAQSAFLKPSLISSVCMWKNKQRNNRQTYVPYRTAMSLPCRRRASILCVLEAFTPLPLPTDVIDQRMKGRRFFFFLVQTAIRVSEWIKPTGGHHWHLKLKWKPCWGQCGSWHYAPVEGERDTLSVGVVHIILTMGSNEGRRSMYVDLICTSLYFPPSFSSPAPPPFSDSDFCLPLSLLTLIQK